MYDTVASQLTNALTSVEAQLCDMESKGLMRSPSMTAQEAFKLVASCDDLEKALDGAMYVQVGTSSRFLSLDLSYQFLYEYFLALSIRLIFLQELYLWYNYCILRLLRGCFNVVYCLEWLL